MNKRTDKQNFSPFYRTLSPIGAAALLYIHINYQLLKQGKGTADHVMPLGDWFLLSILKHGVKEQQISTTENVCRLQEKTSKDLTILM